MATVNVQIDPAAFRPFGTTFPELVKIDGTNFPNFGPAFDGGTAVEDAYYVFEARQYGSGNLSLDVEWYSRSGSTTGAVFWSAAIACVTPGDAVSMEAKSFATATTATTTVNGTARGLTRSTVTISNLDSIAANDLVILRLRRDPTNAGDTMTGDAIVVGLNVSYSD